MNVGKYKLGFILSLCAQMLASDVGLCLESKVCTVYN
jgi:hypothetical protein